MKIKALASLFNGDAIVLQGKVYEATMEICNNQLYFSFKNENNEWDLCFASMFEWVDISE